MEPVPCVSKVIFYLFVPSVTPHTKQGLLHFLKHVNVVPDLKSWHLCALFQSSQVSFLFALQTFAQRLHLREFLCVHYGKHGITSITIASVCSMLHITCINHF